MWQSRQRHVGREVTGASLLFRPHTILLRESGDVPSALKGSKVLSSVAGTEPALMPRTESAEEVCPESRAGRDESFFELAGMQDK